MFVAPHPDDESLAAGVLLQRAAHAGAAIRVLYATDGDNNPWPQRALERSWRIGPRDRTRWGRLRRREARAALHKLAIDRGDAQFLGLPDQGLTDLLTRERDATSALLRDAVVAWRPSVLLIPTITDARGP
jgi:LmbE family N-acetylglucosaminyl deacetylase